MSTKQTFAPVDEQLAALRKGVTEIIREEELRVKLEKSRSSGKPLRVKLGVDPTGPDLTLGHTVVLRKLKHFEDQGHTAIFLIGDFTALVGDPTGRSETRPPLSREQVKANAETYLAQVYKILDRERTEVRYNSEWLDKLDAYAIIQLCAKVTLPRIAEREDFRSRLFSSWMAKNRETLSRPPADVVEGKFPSQSELQPGTGTVYISELLYPILQGYDSVVLKADVELGATEQKFNLLVGRDIQREYGQESQVAVTMPILVGLDGKRKMSKSLGNYIGVAESPSQIFGKVMSISDEVMWTYYELLTDFTMPVIVRLQEEIRTGVLHPMDVKMQLAHNIIAGFHGEEAAKKATDEFQRVFRDRQAPSEMREYRTLRAQSGLIFLFDKQGNTITPTRVPIPPNDKEKWAKFLVSLGAVPSKSEADRLIKHRALEINGDIVADISAEIAFNEPATYSVRIGKKQFFRVVVE